MANDRWTINMRNNISLYDERQVLDKKWISYKRLNNKPVNIMQNNFLLPACHTVGLRKEPYTFKNITQIAHIYKTAFSGS